MKSLLVTVYLVVCMVCVYSASAASIYYDLSARGLPRGKNAFAEVNKKGSYKCRTESIRSENPDWDKLCSVNYPGLETQLSVETRHDRSGGVDQSIGWSYFPIHELAKGVTLERTIYKNGKSYGTMVLTVLGACTDNDAACHVVFKSRKATNKLRDSLL